MAEQAVKRYQTKYPDHRNEASDWHFAIASWYARHGDNRNAFRVARLVIEQDRRIDLLTNLVAPEFTTSDDHQVESSLTADEKESAKKEIERVVVYQMQYNPNIYTLIQSSTKARRIRNIALAIRVLDVASRRAAKIRDQSQLIAVAREQILCGALVNARSTLQQAALLVTARLKNQELSGGFSSQDIAPLSDVARLQTQAKDLAGSWTTMRIAMANLAPRQASPVTGQVLRTVAKLQADLGDLDGAIQTVAAIKDASHRALAQAGVVTHFLAPEPRSR